MGLSIRRDVPAPGGDRTSPRLWTVATSALFARRWIGKSAPQLPQLPLGQTPTLLYFRTRGCTACDLIDMRVGQAASRAKVRLVIVDRYAKSDAPEDQLVYEQPDNVLDWGGAINESYGVGVYPTLILVDPGGTVRLKDVGVKAPVETFDAYLLERFAQVLPSVS